MTGHLHFERQVLLFEIERRCSFADCNQHVRVGLTKADAFDYRGFECAGCERWTNDSLSQRDVPDWWDEIQTNRQVN